VLTWNAPDENLRTLHVEVAPNSADQTDTWSTYDSVGNLRTVAKPLDPPGHPFSTTAYDERNRPYQITDALTHTTIIHYDAGGHKDKVTRANTQVITYDLYDAMNRLLHQTAKQDPDPAAITKYTYDPSGGSLQTMTDPNNNVYTYGYDNLNRKISLTYPGGTKETWTYDNSGTGLLKQFQNRAGNTENFTYDALNRITLSHWDDGLTPEVSTNYDAASRVTSITNSNSTITRTYFNDNLLNTESNKYGDNITRTVTYTYADGRRASLTYPNNAYSFTYTYTGRSQLDTIVSGSTTIANYGYDVNGNLTGRTLDNSTSSAYGYDA
jgi:YD repeat-containing protein